MLTCDQREWLRLEIDRRRRAQLGGEQRAQRQTAVRFAIAFLEEELSPGPRDGRDVKAAARAAGIAPKTLRSARVALGVVCTNDGRSGSRWRLPRSGE